MSFDPFGSRLGFRYIPDRLGRFGFGRYVPERELHDPFGRLPSPATPDPEIMDLRDPFAIDDSVGMAGRNRRRDVARIESLLGRVGALDLAATDGVTGYVGLRLDQAIRRFQRRHDLKVDGQINPGGDTITALAAVLAAADEQQTPSESEERKPDEDFVPERPPETRDRMDSIPTVPGTLDDNEIIIRNLDDILRILGRRRERRA